MPYDSNFNIPANICGLLCANVQEIEVQLKGYIGQELIIKARTGNFWRGSPVSVAKFKTIFDPFRRIETRFLQEIQTVAKIKDEPAVSAGLLVQFAELCLGVRKPKEVCFEAGDSKYYFYRIKALSPFQNRTMRFGVIAPNEFSAIFQVFERFQNRFYDDPLEVESVDEIDNVNTSFIISEESHYSHKPKSKK